MSDDTLRWERISQAFDALVDLAPDLREPRLQALAAQDPTMADEVRALLAADDRAEGVLDRSLETLVPDLAAWETPVGSRLGAYRLLEPLGQGGMGEVWLAERADGEFRQHVALKLLKRGIDTQAVLRRFLQERSILARLNHPSIVRLLDGGMSPDGRPWYAMDRVHGESITAHAAVKALSVAARVDLIIQVAEAVAYAHAQLVVHRDLKPGNILVDADGAPHLLDFGIAKLLEDTGDYTATATGFRLLSPAYAAPEQILGQPVGTATDVYALGVVAFELLTGQLPHRRQSRDPALLASDLDQPTERASTVLARATPAWVVSQYGEHVDRVRISRHIAGDLDVILSKALQRDPARRYATASAFADDLRRWRSGRPIAARPDSSAYRLRTFVRRHRWGVATAAALVLALLAGFGTAIWQAERASQQAQRAELVKEFVLSLFREQDPVARAQAQARSPRELVAEGIERARRELAADPELQLDVLGDLGALSGAMGDVRLANDVLTSVLDERRRLDGADALSTARAASELGAVKMQMGDAEEGRTLQREALATFNGRHDAPAVETAKFKARLSRVESITGDRQQALQLAREAHATLSEHLGPNHLATLEHLQQVASVLELLDQHDEAMQALRQVIDGIERTLGKDHARLVVPLTNLAHLTRTRQDYPAAAALFARGVDIARQQLGDNHPILGGILMRQGDVQRRMGDYAAAAAAFDEAETCLGTTSAQIGQLSMFRGAMYLAQRRWADADAAFQRAHEQFLAHTGPNSPFPWLATMERGGALTELGDLDAANAVLEEALRQQEAVSGADSYDVAAAAGRLSLLRLRQGRLDDARQLSERQIAILERVYGVDHPNTTDARFVLARVLHAAGHYIEARSNLDRVIADLRPGSSTETLAPAIHIESAKLALAEGDRTRAASDAQKAGELLEVAKHQDPLLEGQLRQIQTSLQ